jgi:hypothetical protein
LRYLELWLHIPGDPDVLEPPDQRTESIFHKKSGIKIGKISLGIGCLGQMSEQNKKEKALTWNSKYPAHNTTLKTCNIK